METGDLLSKEELSAINGEWIYDEETDEWYWVENGRGVPYFLKEP